MTNISLERKVEVYESVLRMLNVYGNLMVDHTKMRELMVTIMEWQHARRHGEQTQEEWEVGIQLAFERMANKVGL